jgi:hypothetical protein
METAAEFYSYTIENGACLDWRGGTDRKGYGCLRWKGKNKRAHRLSYELTFGEIPKGQLICHSCDNPLCINPKHLWAGTSKQNTLDMMAKGRGNLKKGVRFKDAPYRPNSKLTEEQVRDIKNRIKKGETMVSISKIYKVSDRTINDINKGKIWSAII